MTRNSYGGRRMALLGAMALCTLLWVGSPAAEANESIQQILDAPENYKNKQVELKGVRVVRLTRQEGETYFYEIQDDFLAKVEVRTTTSPPRAGDLLYSLTGVVTVGPTGEVFLDERMIGHPPVQAAPMKETSWAPIAAAGAAGVLALVLFFLVMRSVKGGAGGSTSTADRATPGGPPAGDPTSIYNQPTEVIRHDESKIAIATPKQAETVTVLRGRLEVADSPDVPPIRFYLPKGHKGTIEYTVGKSKAEGDRYNHIELLGKGNANAVSRHQAKIIFMNGQYQLINLSATNRTAVDGKELDVNESVTLKDGCKIQMGDRELVFRAQ